MYNYGSYYRNSYSSADVDAMVGFGFATIMILFLVVIAIYVLQVVALWKIFKKAGEEGWKAIIPVYNMIILFKISGLSPLLILVYLAGIIPFVGWIATFGITVYLNYNLSKVFGKDVGFAIGLTLLGPIFYLILGFGQDQYIGSQAGTTPTSF